MGAELKLFTSDLDSARANAREVLADALTMDFESVVVVGIRNGQAITCKSKSIDTLQLLGALDLAKHSIFGNIKPGNA